MHSGGSILVVDDDPTHLRIYGWIMNAAGFLAVPALALAAGIVLPTEEQAIDVAVLDYRLAGSITAVDAARQIRGRYPRIPIVLLSDIFGMPDDMVPYAKVFVRKGEPEKLIAAVRSLVDAGGHAFGGLEA